MKSILDSKILHVFTNLGVIFPSKAKNQKKPLDLVHNLEVIYLFFINLKITAKFISGEELSVTGPGKLLEFYLFIDDKIMGQMKIELGLNIEKEEP